MATAYQGSWSMLTILVFLIALIMAMPEVEPVEAEVVYYNAVRRQFGNSVGSIVLTAAQGLRTPSVVAMHVGWVGGRLCVG